VNSGTSRRFRELYGQLPALVQRQARSAYQRFRSDPFHPALNFKKVVAPDIYSVRISLGYRALGQMTGTDIVWFWIVWFWIVWFWIGSHADYDKLL
jgi:hypothetical protein